MPNAVPNRSLRLAILAALTATVFGATTGLAAADAPPPDGSSQSQSSPTPASGTTGSSESSARITFTTPRAATSARAAHMRRVRARHAIEVRAVLREAHRQKGKPYSYGGSGPRAFDCSGLVRFVFGHAVDRWLPHNAASQYHAIQHIKRRNLQPGDLVFQESGGVPFHVGIYAGHGKWWHAPHTGTVVKKQRIYHGRKYYGRVLTYGFADRHGRHRG